MNYNKDSFEQLFANYDHIIIFDFETTGLDPNQDEIIDIGIIKIQASRRFNYSFLVKTNKKLLNEIINLTHITDEMLEKSGEERKLIANKMNSILSSKSTLLVGYNVNFDLGFLLEFAKKYGFYEKVVNYDYLDVMTIFKDHKFAYPHKLEDAIQYYKVTGVKNSHRAFDDTEATLAILQEVCESYNDINRYVNVFGFNPKYETQLKRLLGIQYVPQPYEAHPKSYEQIGTLKNRAIKSNFESFSYFPFLNKYNGFDESTSGLLYDLGISYFNAGKYDLSFLLFQDIQWFSDAASYLEKSQKNMTGFVDENERQQALAQRAIILKKYDEAFMRYRLAGDFEKAENTWTFIVNFDDLKKYLECRCTIKEFERLCEKEHFRKFLENYPNYKEERRKKVEEKFSAERILRIINSDFSFKDVCNSCNSYLTKDEIDFVFSLIRDYFNDIVRNHSAKKMLTQSLYNFVISRDEYKHYFYDAFIAAYAKEYVPGNDPLNLYRTNEDLYKHFLEARDLPSSYISEFAIAGKIQAKTKDEKILLLKSHLMAQEYVYAAATAKELENESLVWPIIENEVKKIADFYNGEAQLNSLLKAFSRYELNIFYTVYKVVESKLRNCNLKPETHKQTFTSEDVYSFYLEKYKKDIVELQKCKEDDLKEQNRFGNRFKAFFNGTVEIKTRQEQQTKKMYEENVVIIVAIRYGFSLETLNQWRCKNGSSNV